MNKVSGDGAPVRYATGARRPRRRWSFAFLCALLAIVGGWGLSKVVRPYLNYYRLRAQVFGTPGVRSIDLLNPYAQHPMTSSDDVRALAYANPEAAAIVINARGQREEEVEAFAQAIVDGATIADLYATTFILRTWETRAKEDLPPKEFAERHSRLVTLRRRAYQSLLTNATSLENMRLVVVDFGRSENLVEADEDWFVNERVGQADEQFLVVIFDKILERAKRWEDRSAVQDSTATQPVWPRMEGEPDNTESKIDPAFRRPGR